MTAWQEMKLGDTGQVVTGKTPSKDNPEDWGAEFLFITPSDYGNYGKKAYSSIRMLSKVGAARQIKRLLPQGSVLVTCIGSDMGKTVVNALPCVTNQQINAIIPKSSVVDSDFLYYLTRDLYETLTTLGGDGTAVPILNKSDFENIEVTIPRSPEQKAIAAVLSSIDDKVDLLHRQNKTLEAMAETLFRRLCVDEAGDEWSELDLAAVTTRITDGAHASPETVELGRPMASVKDMHQWGINLLTCRQIAEADYEELVRADCRPLQGDILIAKDGSYLKHVFLVEADMDVVILSSIAILRPNGKYHPLLLTTFLKLKSTRDRLGNIVTGAVIPRIVLKDFRKFPLLVPPNSLQKMAVEQIEPLYGKCWENNRQIDTLEKLRDTLLPKLMSGEVRVAS